MRAIIDWIGTVKEMLDWIAEHKVAYAEITLTVKGGKVAFVDYRGPLCQGSGDSSQQSDGSGQGSGVR